MIKWGIAATGNISNQFVQGLKLIHGGEFAAVASREKSKAESFAKEYGAKKAYGSYEDLVADPDIDIVYIGTPNDSHITLTKMYLSAGKHVLCEKPMGVNEKQVAEMAALAKEKGLFLMEAMWTRFFPVIQKVQTWLAEGRIGTPRFLSANFGIESGDNWRKSYALSGGSLLDVGIYPLALTMLLFGNDYAAIKGMSLNNNEGIDEVNTFIMNYQDKLATLASAVGQRMKNRVFIEGDQGRIMIDGMWWHPKHAVLTLGTQDLLYYSDQQEEITDNFPSTGYQYEAQHVNDCLEKGLTESPIMPLSDSIAIAKAMDTLRKDFGVVYKED